MSDVKKINILYVDDEINNLTSMKATFRMAYNVFTATSAEEGKKILAEKVISIVISDQKMPEITGSEFLASIKDDYPDTIRILLTGYTDMEALVEAINKGQIYYYLNKPWDEQQMRMLIEKAYEVYSLRIQNKELTQKLLEANEQLEFMLREKLLS
ncbi:MAG: response regulator [Cytophagales bacterium]|nr:response regulator [Cytophagales bacterium]